MSQGFSNILDKVQHQLPEVVTVEDLIGNINSISRYIIEKSHLVLVPKVPTSDDTFMDLSKAIAQQDRSATRITIERTSIIWGVVR
jgi:hypothetical protein